MLLFSRIKVPTGFAMMITSLQLLQMVVGCAINLIAANYKSKGKLSKYIAVVYFSEIRDVKYKSSWKCVKKSTLLYMGLPSPSR